jgi:hypothetical protein
MSPFFWAEIIFKMLKSVPSLNWIGPSVVASNIGHNFNKGGKWSPSATIRETADVAKSEKNSFHFVSLKMVLWFDAEVKNVEVKNVEVKNVEVKNVEVKNVKVKNVEVKNVKVKNVEVKNVEVKNVESQKC